MTKAYFSALGRVFVSHTSVIACKHVAGGGPPAQRFPMTPRTSRTLFRTETHPPHTLSMRPPQSARPARISPSRHSIRARRVGQCAMWTCAAPRRRAMRPPPLVHDALPPRRVPLHGSARTHAAEGAVATCAPRPLPLDTNVMQAGRQGRAPQAQHARRLLGVAAATATTADTSAAAPGAPAADAAVAYPSLRRGAPGAAGARDVGAVAQQEGGCGGCSRSGLLRAGRTAVGPALSPPRRREGTPSLRACPTTCRPCGFFQSCFLAHTSSRRWCRPAGRWMRCQRIVWSLFVAWSHASTAVFFRRPEDPR